MPTLARALREWMKLQTGLTTVLNELSIEECRIAKSVPIALENALRARLAIKSTACRPLVAGHSREVSTRRAKRSTYFHGRDACGSTTSIPMPEINDWPDCIESPARCDQAFPGRRDGACRSTLEQAGNCAKRGRFLRFRCAGIKPRPARRAASRGAITRQHIAFHARAEACA